MSHRRSESTECPKTARSSLRPILFKAIPRNIASVAVTPHHMPIQSFPAASRQREEKIFRCSCWTFSFQHHSNLMWIFHPSSIYSHHWWHRNTNSPSSVWFNIYQMRRAVTNSTLLKHHAPACLLPEDLLHKHCPDTTFDRETEQLVLRSMMYMNTSAIDSFKNKTYVSKQIFTTFFCEGKKS